MTLLFFLGWLMLGGTLSAGAFNADAARAERCGAERQLVKTLADPDARLVDMTPSPATVEQLIALKVPHYAETNSRSSAELKTWEIVAHLVGFKLEADQDIHAVIAGDSGATMIVEFPSAGCARHSIVAEEFADARDSFVTLVGRKPSPTYFAYQPAARPLVRVVGVGFFDKIHGQTGVAPNGIELHGVLAFGKAVTPQDAGSRDPPGVKCFDGLCGLDQWCACNRAVGSNRCWASMEQCRLDVVCLTVHDGWSQSQCLPFVHEHLAGPDAGGRDR